MSVVIKKPLTSPRFAVGTPAHLLRDFRNRYQPYVVEVSDPADDPLEDFYATESYRRVAARMSPGKWVRTCRETHAWSQAQLAEKLGGVNVKRISDWENGRRAISKEYAKKLGKIFRFPADRFI